MTLDDVRRALAEVHDPCSVAANAPLSLVDMGMLHDWAFDDDTGRLEVTLRVTTPGCTMAAIFLPQAEEELQKLDGVRSVDLRIDRSVFWTPLMISPAGAATLAERRARPNVRPQAWRERATA